MSVEQEQGFTIKLQLIYVNDQDDRHDGCKLKSSVINKILQRFNQNNSLEIS